MRIFSLVRNLLALLGGAVSLFVLALIAWGIISPPPHYEKLTIDEVEARIVAGALRLYREAHGGRWPRSLEELKPEFLPTRIDLKRYVYPCAGLEMPLPTDHIIAFQTGYSNRLVVRIYADGDISKPDAD